MTCEKVGEGKEEKVKSKDWTGLPEKETSKQKYIALVVVSFTCNSRNCNRGHTLIPLFCSLIVGVL